MCATYYNYVLSHVAICLVVSEMWLASRDTKILEKQIKDLRTELMAEIDALKPRNKMLNLFKY